MNATPVLELPHKTIDITVTDEGTIILLHPHTHAAHAWLTENIQAESWQMFGDAVAVEHRYADDIIEGMQGDGLNVK